MEGITRVRVLTRAWLRRCSDDRCGSESCPACHTRSRACRAEPCTVGDCEGVRSSLDSGIRTLGTHQVVLLAREAHVGREGLVDAAGGALEAIDRHARQVRGRLEVGLAVEIRGGGGLAGALGRDDGCTHLVIVRHGGGGRTERALVAELVCSVRRRRTRTVRRTRARRRTRSRWRGRTQSRGNGSAAPGQAELSGIRGGTVARVEDVAAAVRDGVSCGRERTTRVRKERWMEVRVGW